jgi:hypothetical protein
MSLRRLPREWSRVVGQEGFAVFLNVLKQLADKA